MINRSEIRIFRFWPDGFNYESTSVFFPVYPSSNSLVFDIAQEAKEIVKDIGTLKQ